MREAPLTDRQKTDEVLYGSCAPRVGGREVTAQSKEGSWTRRQGGAVMKWKIAFVSAMLALAAAAADPQSTNAEPKGFSEGLCEDMGLGWPDKKDCKTCYGSPIRKGPGERTVCGGDSPTNPPFACRCNGKTGKYEVEVKRLNPPYTSPTAPMTPPQRGK